jgi:hypothetical protein
MDLHETCVNQITEYKPTIVKECGKQVIKLVAYGYNHENKEVALIMAEQYYKNGLHKEFDDYDMSELPHIVETVDRNVLA